MDGVRCCCCCSYDVAAVALLLRSGCSMARLWRGYGALWRGYRPVLLRASALLLLLLLLQQARAAGASLALASAAAPARRHGSGRTEENQLEHPRIPPRDRQMQKLKNLTYARFAGLRSG